MIRNIRLHNFKAFQDTGQLEFKPITVLAGPNSGGKSTILQSLLLLKQTLEGPPEIDLNLDGRYMEFTKFNELTYGKPSLPRSRIGFGFQIERSMHKDVASRYFPDLSLPPERDRVPLKSSIDLEFRYKKKENAREAAILDRFAISSHPGTTSCRPISIVGKYTGQVYRIKMTGKGIRLPDRLKGRKIKTVQGRHFVPLFLVLEGDEEGHLLHLPHPFSAALYDLRREVESLTYLGPLREGPRRAYLHSGNPMTEIGDSGQYAAQILWLEKDRRVQYWSSAEQESKELTLMEAVNAAFLDLGMRQTVDIKSEKSIMYQILFRLGEMNAGKAVTIADVGFGLSQLLPILVAGLRSEKSSILLFEQPEIHLHPRLQANLADFFITLAREQRRLIVETHSDHFINRLRRRIAEDPTDELRTLVSILFVNPPHDGEGGRIDPLQVDRFGVIENWPPGFLPEAADEAQAIFSAGLQKRGG